MLDHLVELELKQVGVTVLYSQHLRLQLKEGVPHYRFCKLRLAQKYMVAVAQLGRLGGSMD